MRGGPVLVRAVARDAVGIDLGDRSRAAGLQDVGAAVDEVAPLVAIVLVRFQRRARHRQAPGVDDRVVEVDPVVVLGHVVQHHGDGKRVAVVFAVDLFGFRAPGGACPAAAS